MRSNALNNTSDFSTSGEPQDTFIQNQCFITIAAPDHTYKC